jgi:hypothetical protein
MSGDERFDREIRSALHDLAPDAAPDRLVDRVASIPSRTPAFVPRRSFMRLATALAAAAVIVVVAAAVILTRPGGSSPIAGAPATSTAVPTMPASAPATASPSAASSAAPAGVPVPAGFQAASVTFASPDLGWVLGTAQCSAPPCTSILRTSDGGQTWTAIQAPATKILGAGLATEAPVGSGVSGLRFADPSDGWAFGPDLWATHDGGATWHQVTIPGMASAQVVALEASAGSVQAVLYNMTSTSGSGVRVASSPVGTDDWTVSPLRVEFGAGPVPSTQLVLAGTTGWLLQVDRTVVGGARLVNGTWVAWTPPCASVVGPAVLAASSPTELVAACDVGLWSTPQGEHLYVSHDGGTTFTESGTPVPLDQTAEIANPAAGSVVVAGTTSQGSAIVGSFDGGLTWQTMLTSGLSGSQAPMFTYLGFTTSTQGVAITASGAGTANGLQQVGTLLMTRDGGHTWVAVAFGG